MNRWLTQVVLLCMIAVSGLAAAVPVRAQVTEATVYLRPVDAETGEAITDACFMLQDFSNEGCDANGDGLISFEDVPTGEYVVVQTQDADGYDNIGSVRIRVNSERSEQRFTIELDPISGSGGPVNQGEPDGTATVYLATIDTATDEAITDVCYVLVDFSNEGCDDNADGRVTFEGVPVGREYTVRQTGAPSGYLPVGEFPIFVNMEFPEQSFDIEMTEDRSTTDTVDVSVVPYDGSSGGGLTGACVIFFGGSLEGCDEDGNGRITFEDVPVGSYLLRETQAPPGFAVPADRWVALQVTNRTIYLQHSPRDTVLPSANVNVALVTRDPDTGDLLTGACYIILDASIEGCDENSDGQVDYEGVRPGTYTLTQTVAPDGYDRINDFEIQISEFDPQQSILVIQADEQYEPGFRNVSVALYDFNTGQRVTGPDFCVVLVDFSNEGCDLNSDGQIDFQVVPVGQYVIEATSLPAGYRVYFEDNLVIVEDSNPLSIANALLVVIRD